MKKRIIAGILACFMLFAVGCGNTGVEGEATETGNETKTEAVKEKESGEEPVTIRVAWWGNQVRNDRTVAALDLYAKEHPEVVFESEFIDWASYWEKLSVEAAADELPDIIQMDYSYLLEYQSKGLLKGLNEYVNSGAIDLSDCSETSVSSGKVDDELYALCSGISAQCLLYNKTVTDSLGIEVPEQWTWQEFFEVAQKVYDETGLKIEILANDERTIQNLARGVGEVLLPADGSGLGIADSSIPLKYFELIDEANKSDFHVTVEEMADNSVADVGFLPRNITWCVFTYSSMCVSQVADCDPNTEWGISMWPSYEGDTTQLNYVKPSMFYSVTSNCKHPEVAADVLSFLTNSEAAYDIMLAERGVPIANKVATHIAQDMTGLEKESIEYALHIAEVGTPIDPPSPSGVGEVGTLVTDLVAEVRYGEISAQEAADKFFEGANDILIEAAE